MTGVVHSTTRRGWRGGHRSWTVERMEFLERAAGRPFATTTAREHAVTRGQAAHVARRRRRTASPHRCVRRRERARHHGACAWRRCRA
ncbi:hypothetical protein [Nocardioides convexus]|uniref:hypothetical protein n=1 Tax=Nocardioides convexus TaxID=2712224 RepID=UPI002418A1D8|nr:hypothetical protein [Nocardioides convexus]